MCSHPSIVPSLPILLCGLYVCLGIGGCTSGGGTPSLPPDFVISPSPASVSLTAGGSSAGTAVVVTVDGGFTSGVSVTVTGLPTGVTTSPSSLTVQPGSPQSLFFTASSNAASGPSTVTLTGTSGSITHATTISLNVALAPDFSLALNPAALIPTAGGLGQQTSVTATLLNGFTGTVAISLSGLPIGVTSSPSTLNLAPGAPQTVMFTSAANAVLGASTITITGQSGLLSHSSTLALTVTAPTGFDVVTYHYDNARTGLNPNETILTPANVNSTTFGKINLLPTDGRMEAEPLYLSDVTINGKAHNVVYAVTEHDSIYAFDADSGAQLWHVSALLSGETPSDNLGCLLITPEIGITSTPVIDRRNGANGTIFIVAMSRDSSGAYHQRLHALDITTGAETSGSPTEITATYPGTGDNSSSGQVVFDPKQYAERTGLLLMNHTLYLSWTSHCDIRPYTGWVMAYSEDTLQQTQVLNLTPNGSEGAIWMSGDGLAADTSGNIYLLDANGTLDLNFNAQGFPANGDYGNAILKLSTANNTLAVADFFEPYNTQAESDADLDLGSGGVLLLPDLTDSTGKVRHLVVGAGKDANVYLADRDNLGKFSPTDNSNLYQEIPGALGKGAYSTPAYFNNTLYYCGYNDRLKAFSMTNARLNPTPSSQSAMTYMYPGATPGISANGTTNGIVWALESNPNYPGVLHAYEATNLAHELYNSNQAPNGRDNYGNGNDLITPLIVHGRVYIGSPMGIAVFGMLTQQ